MKNNIIDFINSVDMNHVGENMSFIATHEEQSNAPTAPELFEPEDASDSVSADRNTPSAQEQATQAQTEIDEQTSTETESAAEEAIALSQERTAYVSGEEGGYVTHALEEDSRSAHMRHSQESQGQAATSLSYGEPFLYSDSNVDATLANFLPSAEFSGSFLSSDRRVDGLFSNADGFANASDGDFLRLLQQQENNQDALQASADNEPVTDVSTPDTSSVTPDAPAPSAPPPARAVGNVTTPAFHTNTGLELDEGDRHVAITRAMLLVNDGDTEADALTYTLNGAAEHGTLYRAGVALNVNDRFTQQDIDDGLLAFSHDGSDTSADSFSVTVSDGETTLATQRFDVSIASALNHDSFDDIRAGQVGLQPTVTTAASDLVYTVTQAALNGDVTLNGTPLAAGDTFTQQDVFDGNLDYQYGDENWKRNDYLGVTLRDVDANSIIASDTLYFKYDALRPSDTGVNRANKKLVIEAAAEADLANILDIATRWNQFSQNTLDAHEHSHSTPVVNGHNWGGADPNLYRGTAYVDRERAKGEDPNTDTVIHVDNSMSIADIQHAIDNAPDYATILFAAGTYDFNENIDVKRDNITIRGETDGSGNALVTIDAYDLAFLTGGENHAFNIQKDGFNTPWATWSSPSAVTTVLTTQTAGNAVVHPRDRVIALNDVTGVEAGDMLVLSHRNDSLFNVRTDHFTLESVVEIASVNHVTNEVTLVNKAGMYYDPNRAGSDNNVIVIDRDSLIENVVIKDLNFQYVSDADFATLADPYDFTNQLAGVTDGTAAIAVTGSHSVDIENITGTNITSQLVSVFNAYEAYVNDIHLDGSINNGEGGNGYGLIMGGVFYSDFENLSVNDAKNARHVFIFSFGSSDAFNNVHVSSASANPDYHGGLGYGNLVYIEDYHQRLSDSPPFRAFDYRYDYYHGTPVPANELQNTLLVDNHSGVERQTIGGYTPPEGFGAPHSSSDGVAQGGFDLVYASHNGSVINTYDENDIVISGTGNDTINVNHDNSSYRDSDAIIFFDNSGQDRILSFQVLGADNHDYGYGDRIGVKANINNTGITTTQDMLARLSQSGADTIVDLGGGNNITIEGLDHTTLNAANFFVI